MNVKPIRDRILIKPEDKDTVTASGIVNGNSMRKEIQGVVKKFVVDDMGKVLVHSFDLW